jgi:hypothetical protein
MTKGEDCPVPPLDSGGTPGVCLRVRMLNSLVLSLRITVRATRPSLRGAIHICSTRRRLNASVFASRMSRSNLSSAEIDLVGLPGSVVIDQITLAEHLSRRKEPDVVRRPNRQRTLPAVFILSRWWPSIFIRPKIAFIALEQRTVIVSMLHMSYAVQFREDSCFAR